MFNGEGTYVQLDEPIEITVAFHPKRPCIRKLILYWKERRYVITNVHCYYTEWQGEVLMHYLTVTAGGKSFKLCFNSKRLQWAIKEVYEPY